MVKYEKLLLKFLQNPESLRLDEILKILNKHGYTERQGKGSHLVMKNNGGKSIIIPVHNNDCKGFYKKKVKVILFEE